MVSCASADSLPVKAMRDGPPLDAQRLGGALRVRLFTRR